MSSDAEVMWAPSFATVDSGLLNEQVVMFAPQFLAGHIAVGE